MQDESHAPWDVFLVEDVILTLGNLRGSLTWLADPGPGDDPAVHRAGLERIGRRIALLEDRARAMRRRMEPQAERMTLLADDAGDPRWAEVDSDAGPDEVNIFAERRAGPGESGDAPRAVVFRTRRSGV